VRSIPSGLLTRLQAGDAALAMGLLMLRRDGVQLALTSSDVSESITGVPVFDPAGGDSNGEVITSGAVTYEADGLDVSNIRSSEGFDVDTLEGTLLEGGVIFKDDLLRGLWRGAGWTLFLYEAGNTSDGFSVVKCGRLANVKPLLGKFVCELRDWRQAYQSDQLDLASEDCRYTFGDSRCTVNKAAVTVTGTVTSSGGIQVFTDTGRTEADDWFGAGEFEWLTGNNVGVQTKVKTFAADVFTLAEPMLSTIEVGDTYRAVKGCRKRFREDCITKHSNGVNFGGEPDAPTTNEVVSDTSE
jgi:uncharacterized phage protein (TIGR02218 family)